MATQKLILPINKMSVTAGFKNANYYKKFGYKHYGIDVTSVGSDRTIWGCGVGRILETGFDNVLGNVVVIRYDNCHIKNGTTKNLIQRLYHLNRIDVSKGQSITKDTRIGLYGSTGQHVTGTHLHIEFDTDVNYPTYSPTLGTSSNIIKAGTDSVLNPADVMHIKSTAPDNQSVAGTSNSDCWASSDLSFPMYNGTGETGGTYYPTPNYSGTSLVEALKSIGVDSSFDNREKIANVNGISNYTGTQEQNETLLALLMKGQLKRPGSSGGSGGGETGGTYYPTPNYSGTSLVEALKSIGVDSSFDNREKIANVNGISNYTGTQEQNETLLALLMKGQLKRPGSSGGSGGGETGGTYYPTPNYNGTSLVEALKSIGVDSSFDNREKIANVNGISNYTGTQEQNETLLALLMKGQLKRPGSSGGSGGGETESGSTDLGQVKAGTDSVLNPADVMHIKSTAPDNQSVAGTSNSDCWASSDLSFPMYNGTGETGGTYYPTPNYSGTSLVEALKSIGVDSSFDNREKIANVNGISNYTGTQEQNETLLALLMKGQLKRPGSSGGSGGGETGGTYYPTPNYSGTSLVEALKSIGVDSSFDNREKIANVNGISNYTGTQEQNETLLALLMKGQLKRPGSSG
ncbi:peptidoglycan DD-metalloendopeptidase family protein, partial [Turicibacter sanguinis]|nr:peptidoglycan DD-metalloendopeptidase family protein [Turicibacter sanguinis]